MTPKRELSIEQQVGLRADMRRLLVKNPNHFGTLTKSDLKPVLAVQSNTGFETIGCLGFNPPRGELRATIDQHRSTGYSGDTCSFGSREFVRFYADLGAGWVDVGVAAARVYDVDEHDLCHDDSHPLRHAVAVDFDPRRFGCTHPQLVPIRAILSWNVEPPANQPNWTPIWGEVQQSTVQIAKRTKLAITDLLGDLPVFKKVLPDLPEELHPILEHPFELPEPTPVSPARLVERYRKDNVEPARFAFADAQVAMSLSVDTATFSPQKTIYDELGLDLGDIIDQIEDTTGNVDYEQLGCVGLDNNRSELVATFVVKKASGYSGGLCTAGSTEHVAFWVDWDGGCKWTHEGTVSLRVHDLPVPAGGLYYAVALPVDLDSRLRSCDDPNTIRIRAVLSWQTPPSTADPDALPTWGNRIDVVSLIRPGEIAPPNEPRISILGGIGVADISGAGLTSPTAVFALNGIDADHLGRPCPFGGRIIVHGPPIPGWEYRVMRRRGADAPIAFTEDFVTTDVNGVTLVRTPGADGWTPYLPPSLNMLNKLGRWTSVGNEAWDHWLEARPLGGGTTATSSSHRTQLDNEHPDASITITSGTGDCGKFDVGDVIAGEFTATDPWFGSYSLSVAGNSSAGTPSPSSGTVATVGGTWTLDTSTMTSCGYTIHVVAVDRTIIDSAGRGRHSSDNIGFCL